MITRLARCWLLVVTIAFAAIARAHDPLTSWAVVQSAANGLRFTFSFTEPEALLYLKNVEATAGLPADASFEKIQPSLLKHAADFFEFRAGGAALAPVESQVVMTEDQTIEVRLVFAWPQGDSLQIRAKFLRYVSSEHTTFLNVLDHDEHLVASAMPTLDDPVVVSPLPPRPPAKSSVGEKTPQS